MNKEPKIGSYIDDEEKSLIESIENGAYDSGESILTPERKAELQASAKATINGERTKITLRLPKTDLVRLKERAMIEGVPYQTLISSILHKSITNSMKYLQSLFEECNNAFIQTGSIFIAVLRVKIKDTLLLIR